LRGWTTPSAALTAIPTLLALLVVAFLFAHFGKNTFEMKHTWGLAMRCVLLVAFVVCVIRIVTWQGTPFLCFQF
jgi:predicted neutral ceramidase superfamily lipid hydrolase